MTYTDPAHTTGQDRAEQLLADPLAHLFALEDLEAAAELLERLAAVRNAEHQETGIGAPDAAGGLAANAALHTAAEQLRAAGRFRGVPAAGLAHLRTLTARERGERDA
ncbi:hypothetical protein AS188_00435 [Kocuria flava]|uniref:Uncharacterized protein n=1 Tax=Kocuria flava TaxID=446860 RepID=A0A0U2XJ46_9MICC|nr:hypothetical protein [Kocuria flava]ALU38466.1 hypothetical protein AS188_00435 [Kocuria flava]GEO93100.1 hypothetical protein KFL01_24060 [Kocuria flava]